MMENDPVSYPKVRLAGHECEVRFSCGALIRLKKEHQLDLDQLVTKDPETGEVVPVRGVQAIEQVILLLHAAIGKQLGMSAEDIADQIDPGELKPYSEAVTDGLKKALRQVEPANQAETKPVIN